MFLLLQDYKCGIRLSAQTNKDVASGSSNGPKPFCIVRVCSGANVKRVKANGRRL